MAFLPAAYDGPAAQAYIDQFFVGSGALIEQELGKFKIQVECCKGEGAKMAAMQAEIINQILDGQYRVSQAVSETNTTRDIIQGLGAALDTNTAEIDDRIWLGDQEAQTSLSNLKGVGVLATLSTKLNTKFADTNRVSEATFTELNKNLRAWSVS